MESAIATRCRLAKKQDAAHIWALVRDSGVLDLNSAYLYLLLCTDFSDTTVVAERDGQLLGFVSGYCPPDRPGTLFLWQIGVAGAAQGQGLGKALVRAFLAAPGGRDAQRLETTVAPGNRASLALFQAVARDLGAQLERLDGFVEADFPMTTPAHEPEPRYRIQLIHTAARIHNSQNLTR